MREGEVTTVQQVLVAVVGAPPSVFAVFSALLRPDLVRPMFALPDAVTAAWVSALIVPALAALGLFLSFKRGRVRRGATLLSGVVLLGLTVPASFVVALAPLVHAMGHPD